MNPPPGSVAVAPALSSTTVSTVNSCGSSSMPPQVTSPAAVSDQSPDLLARIAAWTSWPSRGPAARAFTVSRCDTRIRCASASATSSSVTSRTLTSSAIRAVKSASSWASAATTVSSGSGSRTRRPATLRSEAAAEHTSRVRSMAATRPGSAGSAETSGQSARCTDRSPVRPRQISSVTSGSSGAVTRQVTSSAVYRVSNAWPVTPASAPEVSQNRSRERRMYQLVSTSRNARVESQAFATS